MFANLWVLIADARIGASNYYAHPRRTVALMADLRLRRVTTRYDRWPRDMRRIRKSAFGSFENPPTCLRRHDCWIVRAEVDGRLIAYALSYGIGGDA